MTPGGRFTLKKKKGCLSLLRHHSVRHGVIQQNIFNRYKHFFVHITVEWKQNHMLSHMLKDEGAGRCAVLGGPGTHSSDSGLALFLSCLDPLFISLIGPFTHLLSPRSRSTSKKKNYLRKRRMKVQILMNIKFSLYTVAQYLSTKGHSQEA